MNGRPENAGTRSRYASVGAPSEFASHDINLRAAMLTFAEQMEVELDFVEFGQ